MTAVIMPPVSGIPSLENDDSDVAFKVLNNDNLPKITIVGDSIHVDQFDLELVKQRPNGIVIPIRRIPTNLEENKHITKSNGFLNHVLNNKNLMSNFSHSHGNLEHTNSSTKIEIRSQIDKNFTKTLDAKLRKLQREENSNVSKNTTNNSGKKLQSDNASNGSNPVQNKPRFITTVKVGQFLDPPPEVASLLGLRICEDNNSNRMKLYAYASRPRVLDRKQNSSGSCNVRNELVGKIAAPVLNQDNLVKIPDEFTRSKRDINCNITKRLGDVPLPYANLMFERRIARGSNYAIQPSHGHKWNPNFVYAKLLSRDQGDGESAAARAAEARRRAMARRKAQTQQLRGAQLRLSSPPPVQGRRHEQIQTEQYLEELLTNPILEDTCTQTDLFLDRPVSPYYMPVKAGIDADTQIYPGDLFDFDMEVQPILEVLVGKTIEQALIEVLEEEELAALREQQRKFMERRAAETDEMFRLEELEKRLQAEKKRRMADHEDGLQVQQEMEERIAASVLMQGYMADLLPSVLEGLEDDGFLVDNIKQDLNEQFIPWLMGEVTQELHEMVSSRDVLTDMVREILENRAEIYRALNAEQPFTDDEEEGPTIEDLQLKEHLKLQAAMVADEQATKTTMLDE